jgi:hypothetical protein
METGGTHPPQATILNPSWSLFKCLMTTSPCILMVYFLPPVSHIEQTAPPPLSIRIPVNTTCCCCQVPNSSTRCHTPPPPSSLTLHPDILTFLIYFLSFFHLSIHSYTPAILFRLPSYQRKSRGAQDRSSLHLSYYGMTVFTVMYTDKTTKLQDAKHTVAHPSQQNPHPPPPTRLMLLTTTYCNTHRVRDT